MHERQRTPVAGRMKGRRGFRQMLPHRGRVAYLPVTAGQTAVGQTDGVRIAGSLGVLEGPGGDGDRAGRISVGERDLAVQAPLGRQQGRVAGVTSLARRPPEHSRRLNQIVSQQMRFDERQAKSKIVFPMGVP